MRRPSLELSASFVVVLALLAIALGAALLVTAWHVHRHHRGLLGDGERAEGTVVGIRTETRSRTPRAGEPPPAGARRDGGSYDYLVYLPRVRFATAGGAEHEFEGRAASADTDRVGDLVAVVYPAERPWQARMVEEVEGGIEYALLVLGIGPLAAGLVMLGRVPVRRLREHRRRRAAGRTEVRARVVAVEAVEGRADPPLTRVIAQWAEPRGGRTHVFESYVAMPLSAARPKFLHREVSVSFDPNEPRNHDMRLPGSDGGRAARRLAARLEARRTRPAPPSGS